MLMVLFCSIETSSLGLRSFIVFEASSRMNSEVPSLDVAGGSGGKTKKVDHRSSRCLKRVGSGWERHFIKFAIHLNNNHER